MQSEYSFAVRAKSCVVFFYLTLFPDPENQFGGNQFRGIARPCAFSQAFLCCLLLLPLNIFAKSTENEPSAFFVQVADINKRVASVSARPRQESSPQKSSSQLPAARTRDVFVFFLCQF